MADGTGKMTGWESPCDDCVHRATLDEDGDESKPRCDNMECETCAPMGFQWYVERK